MTDYIHDFPLNEVTVFNWSPKDVRLDGYESDREQLQALIELFARSDGNVIRHPRLGGQAKYTDLTGDQRNIRYCNFSTIELVSGWYALNFIRYAPEKAKLNYYPFRLSLFFIGTASGNQQYYELETITDITNDWSI